MHSESVNTDPTLLLLNNYYDSEGWSSSSGPNVPCRSPGKSSQLHQTAGFPEKTHMHTHTYIHIHACTHSAHIKRTQTTALHEHSHTTYMCTVTHTFSHPGTHRYTHSHTQSLTQGSSDRDRREGAPSQFPHPQNGILPILIHSVLRTTAFREIRQHDRG